MGCGINVFLDDVGIKSTKYSISGPASSTRTLGYLDYYGYGASDYSVPWQVTGGDGDMRTVTFTATVDADYQFSRWEYCVLDHDPGFIVCSADERADVDDSDFFPSNVQYSSSETFTYTFTSGASEYLSIRAVSTYDPSGDVDPSGDYTLISYDYGVVSSIINRNDYVGYYDLYRIECSFTTSGTVRFYTTGGDGTADPFGMITTHNDWSEGVPEKPRETAEEFDTVTSFYMEYEVEANKTYYFWWGLDYEPGGGNINVYIVPPNLAGTTYIHNGTEWVKCIPFVVSEDGYWIIVSPYVNDDNQWMRCL